MNNNLKPAIRFKGFTEAWEQRKAVDLAEYSKGNGYSKGDLTDVGTPIILYGRLYTKYQFAINEVDTFAVPRSGAVYSQGNEVIVPASGETAEDIARASAVEKSGVLLGGDLNVLRPFDFINPLFLALAISNGEPQNELAKKAQGKSVVHIHNSDIQEVTIAYPSRTEQDRIVSVFRNLGHLITLHQRKYDQLVNVKKAMLEKMFPRDGKNVPEIRFAGFTEVWEQRKFNDLFAEHREKTIEENEDVLLSCAIEGMFLNSELFSHFRGSSNIGYLKVKKNDLILSAQNLHLGNANVNLRFKHGIISPAYKVYELVECDPLFIQAWVKKDNTKKFFLSATTEGASGCRKNVEWKTLEKQIITVPNLKEQGAIGAYFQSLDSLITLHQREVEKLQNIKKSCLEKMFV